MFNGDFAATGVDLFWDVPKIPRPHKYVYKAVTIPVKYSSLSSSNQSGSGTFKCSTDWRHYMKLYLGKGWKLVEISMDPNTIANGRYTGCMLLNN